MSKMSLIDSNLDTVAFAWAPGPVSAEFPKYAGTKQHYGTTSDEPSRYLLTVQCVQLTQ